MLGCSAEQFWVGDRGDQCLSNLRSRTALRRR